MHPSAATVLIKLRQKKQGITAHDFGRGFRLGARIFDLRKAGNEIITLPREPGTVARYILVREA